MTFKVLWFCDFTKYVKFSPCKCFPLKGIRLNHTIVTEIFVPTGNSILNKITKFCFWKFFYIQCVVIAKSLKCTNTKWQTARIAAYTETVANTGCVSPSGTETASMIVLYKSIITDFNSVQFTSQEILLNQTFWQSAAVFFSGWEYSVRVWGL